MLPHPIPPTHPAVTRPVAPAVREVGLVALLRGKGAGYASWL